MSRGPDAGTLLARALVAGAARAGCAAAIVDQDWTRWASATFTGARHHLTLSGQPSPLLNDWLADLPEAELPLRGHLLADLKLMAVRHEGEMLIVTLEALTVEEG